MRVLYIAENLDKPELFLAQGVQSAGIELTVIIGNPLNAGIARNEFDLRVIERALRSRFDLSSMIALRRIVKEFEPDIVHSFSGRAVSNVLLATVGLKAQHVAYRGTMGNLGYWDPAARLSFLSSRLDKIICVSTAVQDDLQALGIPSSRLKRIYKGHNPEWYRSLPSVSREQFGLSSDEKIIVCVANSRPVKGVDVLVEAFRLVPTHIPARLVLIGEIREPRLVRAIEDNKRITSLGFIQNPAGLIRNFDIFCMPSRRREGFPKALLEAMIMGLPAVVSNVGGMPEIVEHNHSGFVVEPDDPQALAEAITALLQDESLRKRFGEHAALDVPQRFSIETTIAETISLYRELL
jgi:glycosyltransferase involved in cell wall biosynthesis